MPNSGNLHVISSPVILDKTILNEDVNNNANIDRSKMNESQDLNIKTGNVLKLWDAGDTWYTQILHNANYTSILNTSGYLRLEPNTPSTWFITPNANNSIKLFGSGGSRNLELTHDNVDGKIITSYGKLILNPATNIDCNAKEIQNCSAFKFDAAKTRYYAASPGDFVEHYGSPAPPHILDATIRSSSNTAAAYVVAGVHLPHAAVVTSFKVFWYRDDALAAGTARLARIDSSETRLTMATADSDQTVGYHTVEETTISGATIDNSLYTYNIYATLDPNDANSDVRFIAAIITYTITEPNP